MSTENILALATAFIAVLGSVIVAVISVYNNQFAREKWWERKAEAYTRIVSAFSDFLDYYDRLWDHEVGKTQLSSEKLREINERWRQAHREITKATYMGAFIISAEAETVLKRFQNASETHSAQESPIDEIEQDAANAKQYLEQLISCAKKDLKVK